MASKGALKKKKALARRLRKKTPKIPVITNLGDYLQEFLLRGLYMFSLKKGQEIIQATTSRIHALLQDKEYNKIIALLELDKIPRERAQILSYQALATTDRHQAATYINQALRLDGHNLDALTWQAAQVFDTDKENRARALHGMREIVAYGEKQLGPQLESLSGKVHEFILARPYLRSLHTLFTSLDSMGLEKEALEIGQKLLTLCQPDWFTIRDRVEELAERCKKPFSSSVSTSRKEEDACPCSTEKETDEGMELDEKTTALFEEISQKTDAFCQAHLNDKFKKCARRAVLEICQDDSCSVQRGKRESWASGIIHALAQANRLFETGNPLSIQPVTIHTFFKISSSTTSKKSALLRKCLHITPENPAWICPG